MKQNGQWYRKWCVQSLGYDFKGRGMALLPPSLLPFHCWMWTWLQAIMDASDKQYPGGDRAMREEEPASQYCGVAHWPWTAYTWEEHISSLNHSHTGFCLEVNLIFCHEENTAPTPQGRVWKGKIKSLCLRGMEEGNVISRNEPRSTHFPTRKLMELWREKFAV